MVGILGMLGMLGIYIYVFPEYPVFLRQKPFKGVHKILRIHGISNFEHCVYFEYGESRVFN